MQEIRMQETAEKNLKTGPNVRADDGFYFGIGAFETIAVEKGVPQLLERHLERLENSLRFFEIEQKVRQEEVLAYLQEYPESEEKQHGALKITVTPENRLFGMRRNTYTQEQYQKGFRLGFSKIRRNETSPLTYYKTLAIAENILEKRNAKACGLDEKIFLNQKGQISEGCTTNIFFVTKNRLITPPLCCGMLPGVMRSHVLEQARRRGVLLEEREVYPEDVDAFDGCFVTNSLLGVMPAASLEGRKFQVEQTLRFTSEFLENFVI